MSSRDHRPSAARTSEWAHVVNQHWLASLLTLCCARMLIDPFAAGSSTITPNLRTCAYATVMYCCSNVMSFSHVSHSLTFTLLMTYLVSFSALSTSTLLFPACIVLYVSGLSLRIDAACQNRLQGNLWGKRKPGTLPTSLPA